MVETLSNTVIYSSIVGCPEKYRGEHRTTWQLTKLKETAEENGYLRESLEIIKTYAGAISYGTEAEVMFKEDINGIVEVLKAFHPLRHLTPNETLDDFVTRIDFYNQYFPETSLEFKGVSESKLGLTILFSQRYIDGLILMPKAKPIFESFSEAKIRLSAENKIFKQVANELKKRHKFTALPNSLTKYTDGKVIISDVHLGNVMRGTDGKLYFIDLDIVKA